MLADLLAGMDVGRIDRIVVGVGPGSFTGIRVGVAAARALGLAWGVAVTGISALAALAAVALDDHPQSDSVVSVIDANRGEVYAQLWRRGVDGLPEARSAAMADAPEVIVDRLGMPPGCLVIGSGACLLPHARERAARDWPIAADYVRALPAVRLHMAATPYYIRNHDAQRPIS